MTHLSRETLIAWRDHPTDDARAEIVTHLAVCNDCAALYAELIRARPSEAAPLRFDPADFVARGLAARTAGVSRARRWGWILVPVAAAAIVVLAVYVVRRPAAAPDAPVLRGASGFQGVTPAGSVKDVTEFTWSAPGDADSFRIEVLDASGQVVLEARVTGRRFVAPADLKAKLQTGVEYQWLVSRVDSRGQTLESSALTKFRIRSP